MDSRERIEELIGLLNKWAHEYYVLDNISVSDKEYDKAYDELVRLEKETGIVMPYSPTQRVGDTTLSAFKKHGHKAKLWSLDKAQRIEELKDWHSRNLKAIEEYNRNNEDKLPSLTYVVTKKFDGITLNCTYNEEGIMITACTRGTGEVGEDITLQAKNYKNFTTKNRLQPCYGDTW